MNRFATTIAALILLLTTTAFAQPAPAPGSPATNFRDDGLLRTTKAEIAQMPRHQLDLLTDLLATCFVTDLLPDESARRPCDIAEQRYMIAYGRFDATHMILMALQSVSAVIRINQYGHVYETSRIVDIHMSLSSSITQRNRVLSEAK